MRLMTCSRISLLVVLRMVLENRAGAGVRCGGHRCGGHRCGGQVFDFELTGRRGGQVFDFERSLKGQKLTGQVFAFEQDTGSGLCF